MRVHVKLGVEELVIIVIVQVPLFNEPVDVRGVSNDSCGRNQML